MTWKRRRREIKTDKQYRNPQAPDHFLALKHNKRCFNTSKARQEKSADQIGIGGAVADFPHYARQKSHSTAIACNSV